MVSLKHPLDPVSRGSVSGRQLDKGGMAQSGVGLIDLKHVLVILSLNCVLFAFIFSVLVCAFIFVLYFKLECEFKALHNHL